MTTDDSHRHEIDLSDVPEEDRLAVWLFEASEAEVQRRYRAGLAALKAKRQGNK